MHPSRPHFVFDLFQVNNLPKVFNLVDFHLPKQLKEVFACEVEQFAVLNRCHPQLPLDVSRLLVASSVFEKAELDQLFKAEAVSFTQLLDEIVHLRAYDIFGPF